MSWPVRKPDPNAPPVPAPKTGMPKVDANTVRKELLAKLQGKY